MADVDTPKPRGHVIFAVFRHYMSFYIKKDTCKKVYIRMDDHIYVTNHLNTRSVNLMIVGTKTVDNATDYVTPTPVSMNNICRNLFVNI